MQTLFEPQQPEAHFKVQRIHPLNTTRTYAESILRFVLLDYLKFVFNLFRLALRLQ